MRETKCLLFLLMEFEWTIIKRNQLKDYIQILLARRCQNLFLFLTLVFWKGFLFWHFPWVHLSLIPNTMTDPGIWSWEIKNRQSTLHKQKCGKHLADKCVPNWKSKSKSGVLIVCFDCMLLYQEIKNLFFNGYHEWWTGRPGVLRSMGLQRVGHDWVTELNRWGYCCWL